MTGRPFTAHAPGYLEERLLRLISEVGPITAPEYRTLFCIGSATADRHMAELKRRGVLHVYARRKNVSNQTPVFFYGKLPDAPYFSKLTPKEKRDRYEAKAKSERPEEWRAKVKRSNDQAAARRKTDPVLADRRRKANARYAAKKRAELRGGPAPSKCPWPRPKVYRNILAEQPASELGRLLRPLVVA